jgi:hypothetical protein
MVKRRFNFEHDLREENQTLNKHLLRIFLLYLSSEPVSVFFPSPNRSKRDLDTGEPEEIIHESSKEYVVEGIRGSGRNKLASEESMLECLTVFLSLDIELRSNRFFSVELRDEKE